MYKMVSKLATPCYASYFARFTIFVRLTLCDLKFKSEKSRNCEKEWNFAFRSPGIVQRQGSVFVLWILSFFKNIFFILCTVQVFLICMIFCLPWMYTNLLRLWSLWYGFSVEITYVAIRFNPRNFLLLVEQFFVIFRNSVIRMCHCFISFCHF